MTGTGKGPGLKRRTGRVARIALVLFVLIGLCAFWLLSGPKAGLDTGTVRLSALGSTLLVLLFFSVLTERLVDVGLTLLHGPERISLLAPLEEEIAHNVAMADMLRRDLDMLSHPQERIALFTEELAGEAAMARSATAKAVAKARRALAFLRLKRQRRAVALSVMVGLLISAAGFHVLGGIVATIPDLQPLSRAQAAYLTTLDLAVTAVAIAGGSELVHRVLHDFLALRDKSPEEMLHDVC
ncbi:hypothetical protein [Actibacterium ureilyticum]|uniref:hypothetical protein n=1 Tax=Actibacterium ureilyticum TaxID=1590614 RepID=UPI001140B7A6|nr:hypothetical protein [Actibacterium ureilyticum]